MIDLVGGDGAAKGESMDKISITHEGTEYTAAVDGDTVTVAAGGHWAGTGRLVDGRIEDCAADLPDAAYAALDAALIVRAAQESSGMDDDDAEALAVEATRDSRSGEVTVRANADLDDCLQGAAAEYIEEHPALAGYDLAPRWTDDERETVTLTVPAWAAAG